MIGGQRLSWENALIKMEPSTRLELVTFRLQGGCSAN